VMWNKLSSDWNALLKDPRSTTARLWRFVNFAVWRKTFDF